jgi:ATP-binding cassette subfamily B protein/ATP-binding cassette subfamily C protein
MLLLLGVLLLLFRIDWRVGLALTGFVICALVIISSLRSLSVPYWEAERQASADLFGFLEERLSSTEDIRSSGAVTYMVHGLAARSRSLLRKLRTATQGDLAIEDFTSLGTPNWLKNADLLQTFGLLGTLGVSIVVSEGRGMPPPK